MYTRQDERRTVWCRGCKHIHGQDAYALKQMQDKMYTEQEGCRTGRMQVMANKGHDRKKQTQKRNDLEIYAEQDECMIGRIYDTKDAGLCRSGRM